MLAESRHHDILKEGAHGHFLFGRVVEDPEADLVAEPLVRQQIGEVSFGSIWLSRSLKV